MGTIYLALSAGPADFRKLMVVKELRQDLSANPRLVEMFLDEAKLSARLNHPNVVQTLEAGQEGDRYFLSMEFLDGQPYSAVWQRTKQFPQVALGVRLRILCDALAGLHYAHTLTEYDGTNLHIVHRDVSPQNIFVTYDGQVKVVDFGIAKAAVSNAMTTPGVFKGKFSYAAPEQVRGEEVDARSDVFSMGVVLFETITMRRFSDGVVSRDAVACRLAGKEPRAQQFVPEVDARLAEICDRAMAVDPERRYASAEDFRRALEEHLVRTGERVEAATIKSVMGPKFAAERHALHQLIDRHIKGAIPEATDIRAVNSDREAGNSIPTQVADLSRYVSDTNNATVVSEVVSQLATSQRQASSARTRKGAVVAGAAALLGLAVAGSLFWNATRPSEAAQPVPSAGIERTQDMEPPLAAVLRTAEEAPPASELKRAAKIATGSLQATGAGANEAAASARPATPAVEAPKPAQPRAVEHTTPEPRVTAPKPRPRRSAPAHAAPPPSESVAAAPPAPPPPAPEPTQVAAPKPTTKVSVGVDLNRLKTGYQRRTIDTDF